MRFAQIRARGSLAKKVSGKPYVRFIVFSSSISRYIEEHVQRTGVAIETQGFTFVTSGRRRESLTVRREQEIKKKHSGL
jgi:hypothetical protein